MIVSADASVGGVFQHGLVLRIESRGDDVPPIDTKIESASPHKLGVRITLAQVRDRAAAEALAGASVFVHREDMPPLGPGEYYDFEVVGCTVTTPDGRRLGVVTEVLATGASDVYVVHGEHGEILVPAITAAVLSLDVASRQIAVEPTALEYSNSTFET